MWSCGQILVPRGFAAWGVSRTMPVTTALQLVLNGVIGIIAFGEWRAPRAMPLGLTALGLVILGAVACSWNEGTGAGPTAAQRRKGLTVTIGSAFMYGLYPSILRGAGVSTPDALAPMGIGLLLGETRTRKETAVTVVGVVAAVIGVVLLGTASSR